MRNLPCLKWVLAAAFCSACAGTPLYPARPPTSAGTPVADPAPSKVVLHLTVTPEGLNKAIDEALPLEGSVTFTLQGQRTLKWKRTPIAFKFADNKMQAAATLTVSTDIPILGTQSASFDLKLAGEPVVTSDYKAKLQSAKIELTSRDAKVKIVDALSSALKGLHDDFQTTLEEYSFDLAPKILEAYKQLAAPIELPLGDAKGCLAIKVTGVEAGPTVLAGGIEKDLALVVAPSITLPCAPPMLPPTPSPLANVSSLPSGPFTVTIPIAASYDELAKAMSLAFTNGKLFFSKEFPELYLAQPEIYSSQNELVLKLHLGGPVHASGISTTLDGDIFFAGHPAVIDNELQIPDLQPTIETHDFLLKLKAALDGDSIRDQARHALRLDLGARLADARAKVSGDRQLGPGCLRSDVARIEITGVYPHATYLRVYVAITAQTSVYLPCPQAPAPPAPAPGLPVSDKPADKPAEKTTVDVK